MRRGLLLLVLCALTTTISWGQIFFAPEVVVRSDGLSDSNKKELKLLEEELTTTLLNFSPDVQVELAPKHPIKLSAVLFIKQAFGNQYQGDLEMAFYRPRYGKDEESLLLLVREEGITFRYLPTGSNLFLGRDIPENQLGRMVYFLATLGVMYYYDSFSVYGGTPFLAYLQQHKALLATPWEGMDKLVKDGVSRYAPSRVIEELKSLWGEQFRELWYVYHRQALDGEVPTAYGEGTKVVLEGLKRLREENGMLSFIALFGDAKMAEISHFIQTVQSPLATEVSRLAEDLFPAIVFRR